MAPTAAAMLTLQRAVGNRGATRVLQRKLLDLVPQHPEADFWADVYKRERAAREAFIKSGTKGPITYDPSKRNKKNYYGGFDVTYDPAKQELKITLKGVVNFKPGIRLVKNWAIADEGSPEVAAEAAKINKLKVADRAAEVLKWRWSSDGGPDAGDDATFLTKFKTAVEDAWRGKHAFHCTRAGWEDLGATVDIDVQVVKADATNKKGAPNHVEINAFKVPPGFVGGQAAVSRPGGAAGGPFKNALHMTSVDVDPRGDDLLERRIGFVQGTTVLDPNVLKNLKALAKEMPNLPKGANVTASDITVKATGADAAERKARYDAIVKALTDAGMQADRIKFVDAGVASTVVIGGKTYDRLQLQIGDGKKQVVAAHESGHLFGLDDEYIGSGAYAPGKVTEHEPLAKKENMVGVMHAKSDSIMSEGSVVREQHYLTFLDALKVVTNMEQWGFGGPRAPDLPDALKPLDPDAFY